LQLVGGGLVAFVAAQAQQQHVVVGVVFDLGRQVAAVDAGDDVVPVQPLLGSADHAAVGLAGQVVVVAGVSRPARREPEAHRGRGGRRLPPSTRPGLRSPRAFSASPWTIVCPPGPSKGTLPYSAPRRACRNCALRASSLSPPAASAW